MTEEYQHLNPDYVPRENWEYQPPTRSSYRSFRFEELTPALLVQEVLNRGETNLPGRLRSWQKVDGGYLAVVNMQRGEPIWEEILIPEQEVAEA